MSIYPLPTINNNIEQNDLKIKFIENKPNNYISKTLAFYLNKVKARIDKYSIEWDAFKKITNNYEYIHTIIPNSKYSISKLKPLSRAFYKLVEICNTFNLLEKFENNNIISFHLAEGPGGFIEATNFIRKNKNDKYFAITLIDEDNDNIPGWKKSGLFLRKNKNIIIEKGLEGKGDLYNPENYKHYYRIFKNKVDFITADGGFDFSIDFNNQENMAVRLIFTEVIYAISMQKQGGCFVLKLFDIFLKSSVDIIYLLCTMYNSVSIFKPNTSRIANSERYIICDGFKYDNTDHLYNKFYTLLKVLNHKSMNTSFIYSIFNIEYPYKFKQTIEEINSIIGSEQIDNIQTTIRFIENKERRGEKIQQKRDDNIQKCISWCIKNKIPHNKIQQNTNIFMSNRKIGIIN
jgi:23S rRNA U2552 (ribose-2'-O)-methylase RlmE/FtsJ